MLTNVLSDGLGTLLAVALVSRLAFLFISDITQKKHGVLRNYPVVGHLRYFFEELGEYFRQYFFSGDREEMPFNRATRAWVYRLAKNEGGTIGFGSTYDMHQPGALSPYHLEGGPDLVMQIGTAKYGVRDARGDLSRERLAELANVAKAFEIKLSQGAKPGKGGLLPGHKVTAEIAQIRAIPEGRDSISPNRHHDIANIEQLLDKIAMVRELTGRPVGVKTAVGGWGLVNAFGDAIHRRGLEFAPDFLVIDGGEGGSGAAPQALADHMGLSIDEALPRVVEGLIETGLRSRIRVVASGKLITWARAAWALCVGADFVNTARGFMFSLGCIQALRCHTNTCPTGVTTHNKRLQRALVVEEKYLRVANYCSNMNRKIDMIAHSCGVRHARELKREHVRIVQASGQSVALNMLSPYPDPRPRAA